MKKIMAQADGETGASESSTVSVRSKVLTKATIRVAERLGLGQADLAKVIGISASTASRMFSGGWTVPEHTKQWSWQRY